MARYLDISSAKTKLSLGKSIEVFLGREKINENILGYLVLNKIKRGKIEINHYQCFDEGNLDFVDIYSFSEVEGKISYKISEFDTLEDSIEYIKQIFKLEEIRFVNEGVSQSEYEDLLKLEQK